MFFNVNDGNIVEENIRRLGFSIASFEEFFSRNFPVPVGTVYVATLDTAGTLYYSEK